MNETMNINGMPHHLDWKCCWVKPHYSENHWTSGRLLRLMLEYGKGSSNSRQARFCLRPDYFQVQHPPTLLAYEVAGATWEETVKIRVEFTEQGTRTRVRLTHVNVPDQFSKYVIVGWSAAFGKLDKFLVEEATAA